MQGEFDRDDDRLETSNNNNVNNPTNVNAFVERVAIRLSKKKIPCRCRQDSSLIGDLRLECPETFLETALNLLGYDIVNGRADDFLLLLEDISNTKRFADDLADIYLNLKAEGINPDYGENNPDDNENDNVSQASQDETVETASTKQKDKLAAEDSKAPGSAKPDNSTDKDDNVIRDHTEVANPTKNDDKSKDITQKNNEDRLYHIPQADLDLLLEFHRKIDNEIYTYERTGFDEKEEKWIKTLTGFLRRRGFSKVYKQLYSLIENNDIRADNLLEIFVVTVLIQTTYIPYLYIRNLDIFNFKFMADNIKRYLTDPLAQEKYEDNSANDNEIDYINELETYLLEKMTERDKELTKIKYPSQSMEEYISYIKQRDEKQNAYRKELMRYLNAVKASGIKKTLDAFKTKETALYATGKYSIGGEYGCTSRSDLVLNMHFILISDRPWLYTESLISHTGYSNKLLDMIFEPDENYYEFMD